MRVSVIDAYVLRHVLAHPARGYPWTIRELAEQVGISHAALGFLHKATRDRVARDVAARIAEAVGVHPAVLFEPWLSTESDTSTTGGA